MSRAKVYSKYDIASFSVVKQFYEVDIYLSPEGVFVACLGDKITSRPKLADLQKEILARVNGVDAIRVNYMHGVSKVKVVSQIGGKFILEDGQEEYLSRIYAWNEEAFAKFADVLRDQKQARERYESEVLELNLRIREIEKKLSPLKFEFKQGVDRE